MSRQFFCDTEYFPFEKKNRSCQIQTQDLRRARRTRYLQNKCAGDKKKQE